MLELLKKIKAKIATRDTWCQGAMARNSNGHCSISDGSKWCLVGAVYSVCRGGEEHNALSALYSANHNCAYLYMNGLTYVNDILGFETVHQVLDEAIANAQVTNL